MANKSNSRPKKKGNPAIPPMGKNKGFYQQPMGKQIFDKRVKDNAKVKY